MRRPSKSAGHGAATWVVTFADLVSLLMAFFVMLLSFSVQDQQKLSEASGSMKSAFGFPTVNIAPGVVDRRGSPAANYLRNLENQTANGPATLDHPDANQPGQEANTFTKERTDPERAAQFALAAASLKQAWQDKPEITSLSDNVIVEPTTDGLNIIIADQNGRAMFPNGSKYPFEITRRAVAAMAPALQSLPNQIRISGHMAAGTVYANPHYGEWELSFDRADAIRQVLEEFGVSGDRIQEVVGRGDTDPFFPNDPYLSANDRVTITLLYEPPPVPAGLAP